MNKVGNKRVLFYGAFLIPVDEKADFEIDFNGSIKIIVSFDDSGEGQSIMPITGADGQSVELVFKNWNNGLGTSLKEHIILAEANNGDLLKFIPVNYRIGNINKFEIQFVVEVKEK